MEFAGVMIPVGVGLNVLEFVGGTAVGKVMLRAGGTNVTVGAFIVFAYASLFIIVGCGRS